PLPRQAAARRTPPRGARRVPGRVPQRRAAGTAARRRGARVARGHGALPAHAQTLPGGAALSRHHDRPGHCRREAEALRRARAATLAGREADHGGGGDEASMASRRLKLVSLLRPHAALLGVAFAAMLVEAGTDLLEPWPLKVIFDYVLGTKSPPHWLHAFLSGDRTAILDFAAASVIAIAVLSAASAYTQKYLSTTVAKRIGYELRHILYHHVQRLSLSFYEQRQTGDMVVRLTSDIDAAEDFFSSAILGILLDLLTLVGMLGVMFYLDWRFSVIALSVAPLLFVVVYRYTRRIKTATRAVKRQESELASVVQESIASARVVKAFAREEFEEGRLDHESQESVDLGLRARSIKAMLPPVV